MNYKEWKLWYRSVPKHLRWFIIIVLLRPVVDNFYMLKQISPFLSPLYIVGVLTPVLIMYSISKSKNHSTSSIDSYFRFWGILMLLVILVMGIINPFSFEYLENALKISLPLYLYFFLRYFIRSRKDLDGILQTFMYSAIPVAGIFLFELFVHPIRVEYSRSFERIQGYYADVFSYAIYITLCTLISFYFFLKPDSSLTKKRRSVILSITLLFAVAMLFKINHMASYIVVFSLIVLFVMIYSRKNIGGTILVMMLGLVLAIAFGQETFEKKITPLIQTDLDVQAGEKEEGRLLHGRVSRWEGMMQLYKESSFMGHFFGLPYDIEEPYAYISVGPHNDFLRNLFCTGILGLGTYLLILFSLFRKILVNKPDLRYLGLGTMACIMLYSMSTTPTIYATFLYIIISIFAYFSIPIKTLRMQEANGAK